MLYSWNWNGLWPFTVSCVKIYVIIAGSPTLSRHLLLSFLWWNLSIEFICTVVLFIRSFYCI